MDNAQEAVHILKRELAKCSPDAIMYFKMVLAEDIKVRAPERGIVTPSDMRLSETMALVESVVSMGLEYDVIIKILRWVKGYFAT